MTPQRTIVVGFDMETDIGSWTSDVRGVKEGTPEILRVLKSHGLPATFLFTGRECRNHPAVAERVLADGHEIGCHTMYHETVGTPVYDTIGANFTLDSEVKARLALATETIEQTAGVRPVSFRAPRLFGSTVMIVALEELGYVADSSFPSYFYGRDFLPYRPSREDWSQPGEMKILELPVFYDPEGSSGEKQRGRDQWPMLRLKGAAWFSDLCLRLLGQVKDARGRSVLCVYLHPWEFVEMPQTIAADEATISFKPFLWRNTGAPALRALDEFLSAMKANGVAFMTMKDVAATW
jgi:peptidoglycan/xylan/chitin deacetylase (PgdA/CDA1 family)